MLDVKNVSKTFAKGTVNEHIALEKINLHLDRGEFLTIVGSNGAGKSTLFNLICGTFMQDSGTVTLDGQDISFLPEHRRAKLIGRVFQDPMKGTADQVEQGGFAGAVGANNGEKFAPIQVQIDLL